MTQTAVYGGLFVAAFAAASVLPAQSEGILLGLVATDKYSLIILLAVASAGNILGSLFNWWLGLSIQRFKNRKWFPVGEDALARAQNHYARYGRWSLLLSWVPFIGDPITVVAGIMRERIIPFLILVSITKTGRYIALVYLYLNYAGT
jgi:membrane protein YqaA with SNARE-associated domain